MSFSTPDDLDYFIFTNGSSTTKVGVKLGRWYLLNILASVIGTTDPLKTSTLTIPPNYVIWLWESNQVSGNEFSDVCAGEYFDRNGALPSAPMNGHAVNITTIDITQYLRNTQSIIEIQRYDNTTFVTNCIYSFTIPLPNQPSIISNRGGVTQEICGTYPDLDPPVVGMYNNEYYRTLRDSTTGKLVYPATGIGAPPATPSPTPFIRPPEPPQPSQNMWVWILISVGVFLILTIILVIAILNMRKDPPPEIIKTSPPIQPQNSGYQ